MYKDKQKQRESNRKANKRYRERQQGITPNDTVIPESVIPEQANPNKVLPANYSQVDCACLHCRGNRTRKISYVLNHGPYKPADELGVNELNRVSLPGDKVYSGAAGRLQCQR
jgi:hypothetical protein